VDLLRYNIFDAGREEKRRELEDREG